jgi:hypothetical protein
MQRRWRKNNLIHNIDVGREEFPAYNSYANPETGSGANTDKIINS